MRDRPGPTTWRYAITRERVETPLGPEDFFTVREVYTAADGALSWSTEPIAARGDTWMECADDLSLMNRAVDGKVLDLTLDPPRWVSILDLRRKERAHD